MTVSTLVPPEKVLQLWPVLAPHFATGEKVARGYFTAQNYHDDIVNGISDLWAFWSDDCLRCLGVACLDFRLIGTTPVYVCRFVSGSGLEDLLKGVPEVEDHARRCGAERIIFNGRPGLSKALPDDYKVVEWVYEKKL